MDTWLPFSSSLKCLFTKHIRGLNMSSRDSVVLHDSLLRQSTRKQVSADLKARSHVFVWQHRLIHISKSPTSPMLVKFPAFLPRSKVTSSVVLPAMQIGARCFRCFFPVSVGQTYNKSGRKFADPQQRACRKYVTFKSSCGSLTHNIVHCCSVVEQRGIQKSEVRFPDSELSEIFFVPRGYTNEKISLFKPG